MFTLCFRFTPVSVPFLFRWWKSGGACRVTKKLQNCKRTKVSGSEDAHPEGGRVTHNVRSSNNWSLQEAFQNKRLMKQVMQKNDKMLKWRRVGLVSERWWNSEWNSSCSLVSVSAAYWYFILLQKAFLFNFAGVSGAWWDDCASRKAPADLRGFTFIFFPSFCLRDSQTRNCESVLIRIFSSGRSSVREPTVQLNHSFQSFLDFMFFKRKLVHLACSCFSRPLGVTGPHTLDLCRAVR